jgi:endoglycosylceramidase
MLAALALLLSVIFAGCNGQEGASDAGFWDAGSCDGGTGPMPDPRFIYDEQGRVMILHGVNVVFGAKSKPYVVDIPKDLVTRLYADWGLNFVRYLAAWAGTEPQPGAYDHSYLDKVEERLNWFHEAGISVLLDVHQDVYSEFTCGNGFPKWAVRTDGEPISCPSQWFLGYFEPGVKRCFDNFWNYGGANTDLQEHYIEMWGALAARFKDHPAVLAYDIINEPHPGSDFDAMEALGMESPESPSPGFDRNKLQPFYKRVISKIRESDPDTWIAFEPRYGAPGNGSPSYMPRIEDPRNGPPRLLYAPHLYSVPMESSQNYDPAADKCIPNWEKNRIAETAKLGTPLIAGEWGVGPGWVNSHLFMSQVVEMADRLMAGWAYWALDPGGWSWLNSDGTERSTANIIVRAYPQRIAGIPKSYSFDPATLVFRLEFESDPAITAPTEIYIPAKRFYPRGFDLTVNTSSERWSMAWDPAREVASVTIKPPAGTYVLEVRSK